MSKMSAFAKSMVKEQVNPFLINDWAIVHSQSRTVYLREWATQYNDRRQWLVIFFAWIVFSIVLGSVCLQLRSRYHLQPSEFDFLGAICKISAIMITISLVGFSLTWTTPHPMLVQFREDLDILQNVLDLSLEQLQGASPMILRQFYAIAVRESLENLASLKSERADLPPILKPVGLDLGEQQHQELLKFLTRFGYEEEKSVAA